MPRLPILVVSSLVILVQAGCNQGVPRSLGGYSVKSEHVSSLNHVVLVSLQDPAEAEECLADCRDMLARIEVVETIWVGTHLDTGREAVDGEYEVGLCVGLADADALQAYLDDPLHLELVEKWRPKAVGFRIFDIGGATDDR